jgi:Zn-dependent peptidase ImmA (M78 family)/DNA-binding XRE family transcriptional regulator
MMINGDRIKQARELRGLTQAELAEHLQINRGTLTHYEVGRYEPPEDVLDAIALQTGFPLSFFQQETAIDFPFGSLLFRARATVAHKEKLKAHRYGQTMFEMMDILAQKFKDIQLRLPRQSRTDPQTAAIMARSELSRSPEKPIENIIHVIEKSGVRVLALPEHITGVDAYSVWAGYDEKRPALIISVKGVPGDRLRLSVAHELGHLVMHQWIKGSLDILEREAYQFAAEFLMPAAQMQEELAPPLNIETLKHLKEKWGVSIQALIRRSYDLRLISERQYRYLFFQIGKLGWRTAEPILIPVEKPRLLRQMVERLYGHPTIDYQKMAGDMNLPVPFVRQVLEAYAELISLPSTEIEASSNQNKSQQNNVVPFRNKQKKSL